MPSILNDTSLQILQGMILKIFPLYIAMGIGFIFGRARPNIGEPLAYLQINFIVPIFVVATITNLDLQINYLLLPVVTFLGCTLVGFTALKTGQRLWKDNTPNLFAHMCGNANTGYYGIPVALIVFPHELLGLYMLANVGFTLYDCTVGYYWIARGHFTAMDSLRKLFRLPFIYAFMLGIIFSACKLQVPDFLVEPVRDVRGCYIIIAAMLIGIGLSRLQHFRFEAKPISFTFFFKFLVWPALALAFTAVDLNMFHLFTPQIHKILILLSIMPLPANTIAYALQLNVQPDRASTLVFLSTIFALIYVPFMMVLYE
jgi:predicted permease